MIDLKKKILASLFSASLLVGVITPVIPIVVADTEMTDETTEPEIPVDPPVEEPEQPTDPNEPIEEPEVPEESTEPSEPIEEPEIPEESTEPSEPVEEPEIPDESTAPEKPVNSPDSNSTNINEGNVPDQTVESSESTVPSQGNEYYEPKEDRSTRVEKPKKAEKKVASKQVDNQTKDQNDSVVSVNKKKVSLSHSLINYNVLIY